MSAVREGPAALVERDRSWHGPASVAGSVVGSIVVLLMVAFTEPLSGVASEAVLHLLPWALGLPMLLVPGAVRRFGVGLLASGLLRLAVPGAVLLVALVLGGR